MNQGTGPAGEITMDDIRQRLASITARFAAMRDAASGVVTAMAVPGEPGQPDSTGGDGGAG